MDDQTLPCSIPGLLRRTSPVVASRTTHTNVPKGTRGVALVTIRRKVWQVGWDAAGNQAPWSSPAQVSCLALDLSDPTGRWHAAIWAEAHPQYYKARVEGVNSSKTGDIAAALHDLGSLNEAVYLAYVGGDMTLAQIAPLRDLVLRLAGL